MNFNTPITFNKDDKTFEGKKRKYKILETLPVCRYKEVGVVEAELSFGCDLQTIYSFASSVYNNANANGNRGSDAVNAYKLMESIQSMKERTEAIFKFIDLYTIAEGQELDEFGGTHLDEKIEDWGLLDVNFFFALCTQLIPNYLDVYKQLSQSISQT